MSTSAGLRFAAYVLSRRTSAALGIVAVLLGVTVVLGWHAHWLALVQLRPNLAPMHYNSAWCFIAAGVALASRRWNPPRFLVPMLGALVAIVGGLSAAEDLFGLDLGIDQLLFHNYLPDGVTRSGRMSPGSAVGFYFIGLSLLAGEIRRLPRRQLIAGSLAAATVSIGAVALLGYAFGLPGIYRWGQLTQIALHTATGFVVLGTGLFITAWRAGGRAGERTPRWLPIPLGLAALTATLILYFALDRKQDDELTATLRMSAANLKSQLVLRMEARLHSIVRMASRWEFSGRPDQAAWEADALNYVRDLPDVQALEWIDPSHHIRWIAPLDGNEAKVDQNLLDEPRRREASERARLQHQPMMTGHVTLFRGGSGFVIYVPIGAGEHFDGWLALTVKAKTLFHRFFPTTVATGEALRISEDHEVLYERGTAGLPRDYGRWSATENIELPGTTWQLQLWPTRELLRRTDDPLPEITLFGGCLAALMLGVICMLAQRSSRHATEMDRANTALHAALDEVKTLKGLLPICASCKRVRDDTGYWSRIESYLSQRTAATFSHSYCPECAAKAFTEFGLSVPDQVLEQLKARNYET